MAEMLFSFSSKSTYLYDTLATHHSGRFLYAVPVILLAFETILSVPELRTN